MVMKTCQLMESGAT